MRNKKGFTMVELLAVIVILGIIMTVAVPSVYNLIKKSKAESLESSRSTLIMAAKSYMQENERELPKNIGQWTKVDAKKLRDTNYLKEDIKNADNKSCMKDSLVRIYKYDTSKYNYSAYLYCEGDKIPESIEPPKPTAKVNFTDSNDNPLDIAKKNVATAKVKIKFDGNTGQDGKRVGIDGYNYIILVEYDGNGNFLEIYNSGSLNAYGKENFEVSKDITHYIDVRRASNFKVIVEAYNREGGHLKETTQAVTFLDDIPPECGKVTGAAKDENDWDNRLKRRKITVECDDKDGSGCAKSAFTKTFTEEGEWGTITIKDNSGNSNKCRVRVNLDWTAPTLTINAYKLNEQSLPIELVATATANVNNNKASLKNYKNGVGTDSWLNKANYPNGVYYEVITDDNVKRDSGVIGDGSWNVNSNNLTKNASNINSLKLESEKKFSYSDNKTFFSLVSEGYRTGEYELKDVAGNKSTINIVAAIDRTPPSTPFVKLFIKNNGTDLNNSNGLSPYTSGKWINKWVFTKGEGATDGISGFDIYKYTVTGASKNEAGVRGNHRNINKEGTSYISYSACDKALNCSTNSPTYTIKLDRTVPTIKIDKNLTKILDGKKIEVNKYGTCDNACYNEDTFGNSKSVDLSDKKKKCFDFEKTTENYTCFEKKYACSGYIITCDDSNSGLDGGCSHTSSYKGDKVVNAEGMITKYYPITDTRYTAKDNAGNEATFLVSVMNSHLLLRNEPNNLNKYRKEYTKCTKDGWVKK